MSCNKEISSCTAPEGSGTPVYHASGKFLNSSSNALRHILRTYKFSKLYMPAYCSREMKETALQECREVLFYTVGPELKPAGFFPKTSAIYYPNYFGVCGRTVRYLGMRHPNLIVDNSQSFYSDPRGLGSLYDPSSYFGLPDGGIAVSRKGNDTVYPDEMFSEEACADGDENLEGIENIESAENADEKVETVENIEGTENIENSVSSANTENPEDTKTAESSEAKAEEVQAVQIINMSSETRSLLENMDHDSIKARRLRNFRFLAKHLEPEKEWRLFEDDVPFAYPYFTEDFQIHQLFEESEFKLPVSFEGTSGYAEKLTRCYLPLSVDQKYDINDMKVIAEMILGHEVKVEKDDWLLDAASDETTEELELNEAVSADADDEAEAETQQDASQDTVEENPENVRTQTLKRYRKVRMLPSAKRFTRKDVKKYLECRRELMPLLREELEWLNEQQKIHENKEYKLTVLLVTYNHLRTLSTALESILQQETTYPFIIKIIDDCSNDGTARICLEYARLYPDKILYCPEVLNSGAINITAHIRKIKTPYYTLIDGDDRWCCTTKIQRALDFLEGHPEYSAFTHDTRFRNLKKNTSKSYTHGILHVQTPPETFQFKDYFYTHITARVHRNNINWEKEYPNVRLRDIYLFYLSLDRGPFYYCDEIMSEYIFSGQGAFSSLSFIETQYSYNMRFYMINVYTKFRNEKVLRERTKSKALNLAVLLMGKRLGWWTYTKYRKYRLLWDFVSRHIKKLDFIEYKHHSYSRCERLIRDEIWENRFQR